MATAEQTKFIRPDGKDKVTGLGRYTADLTMTGMLHACFRYADHAHARIRSIDTSRARALPGVFCVLTQDDVPDVRYGAFVEDRTLFARDVVRYEGEVVAAVAATTPEIAREAAELIDVDYEPLPVVSDVEAALTDGATLVHEGWSGYSASEDVVRRDNDASRSTIVKGDVDAALASADEVVKERYVADMSHAVPIEPHAAIAQWQGDRVTVWSSTQVPYIARVGRRDDARAAREPRPHHRPPPRRRVRREVRVPLRGPRRGPCPRHRPPRQARVLAERGVHRPRPPPRGPGDRARDRRHARRDDRRPARPADPRQRRLQRRRPVLPAARGDARRRAVPHPQRVDRRQPGVHEHDAVGVGARAHSPAGVLGRRAAHGLRRGGDRHGSRRAAAQEHPEGGRHHRHEPGARADRRRRDAGARGRADRLRQGPARRRGDRGRLRLVALVRRPVRRLCEAERRRLRHDHHRRPGVRHGRGHGAPAARRRGARDAARRLLDPLPGHRRGPVGRRRVRLADDVQQRPRRHRGGPRGAPAAARAGRGGARGEPRGHRARRRSGPGEGRRRRSPSRSPPWPRRPRATGCSSARAPARRRRHPTSTRPAAPAASGSRRSPRRRSSRTPSACGSIARPACAACSRWPRRTTAASS